MCKHQYSYFATCRHQQSVLFEFCEHARSIATAPEGTSTAPLAAAKGSGYGGSRDVVEGQADESVESALAVDTVSRLCSTFTSSSQSAGSSFHIGSGSVSVTADPSYFASSLPDYQSSHSFSASASHDMAGLPLFAGTLWHRMAGAQAPKQADMEHAFTPSELVSTLYFPLGESRLILVLAPSAFRLRLIGAIRPRQATRHQRAYG